MGCLRKSGRQADREAPESAEPTEQAKGFSFSSEEQQRGPSNVLAVGNRLAGG